MADYNLSGNKNFVYFTDTSGSAIYDSGGPDRNYGSNENFYFGIYPAYATGALTVKITSYASEEWSDFLRVFNGIPPTTSFNYGGHWETGHLVKILNGTIPEPAIITIPSGIAYFRWHSDYSGTRHGFRIEWTGSGIYTVNSSSNIPLNKYAATFPIDSNFGSYMTFEKGMLSSSSTLSADKDIITSFWAKFDPVNFDYVERNILGIGNNAGNEFRISRVLGSNTLRLNYTDNRGGFLYSHPQASEILMGGGTFDNSSVTHIPQWHHYGIVLNKTSDNRGLAIFYRDGQMFSSHPVERANVWGTLTSSVDTVLASARTDGTIIDTIKTWSGSFDDVFLATVKVGSNIENYNRLFSKIFNGGMWSNPITVMSSSFNSVLEPTVVFNWRFEETGSMLRTKDYGSFGNYHSASSVVNIASRDVSLTPILSGISYTPYSSLEYLPSIINNYGSVRFVGRSYSTKPLKNTTIQVERYEQSEEAQASVVVSVSASSTATAGVDYVNIFPYTINWNNQENGIKNIGINIPPSWNTVKKLLILKFTTLTNLESGSILSASVEIEPDALSQSSSPHSNTSTNYAINDYSNLPYQFTRRTQQVPFSFQRKGMGRLRKP